MTAYLPPIRDMEFVLRDLADLEGIAALPGFEEASNELVSSVLEEAGRIAEEVLAPLNQSGDREGAKLVDGKVQVAEGWQAALDTLIEGNWLGLPYDAEWGGMGLPGLVNTAVGEMWQSANMAFALCPMLTQGAANAIDECGSPEQKATYLPNLVTGKWAGTMNLTESGAGSDLGAIRTKAVKDGDQYLISGQKIFITYGDHEMVENVIHLVLARTPDAPPGVKGISLFIVPKFLINADGSLGARNDVHAVSLEHKMGIHASPTAVMSFGDAGGAIGYLVGEENRGLEYMFVMMNHARLNVGVQVHGGMGFIEETGACQHLRDARITTIYEGTTAIQANDLVNRKILRDQGATARAALADVVELAAELSGKSDEFLKGIGTELTSAAEVALQSVEWLLGAAVRDPRLPAAAAVPLLRLLGYVLGGYQLARSAKIARARLDANEGDQGFYLSKLATAWFYAESILPQVHGLAITIIKGSRTVMSVLPDQL